MDRQRTALVLGAAGGIGGEVARTLLARGWAVRALRRTLPDLVPQAAGDAITWLKGDAMNAEQVIEAARGTALIVHAVNPPGYRDWDKLVLPMLDNSIAAAHVSGAPILLPGTVYNYGPDTLPVPTETSPQNPQTRKGAIRVEMESRLRRAAETGVRTIVVRAGDYFGPRARNNWFSQGLVTPGRPVRTIRYPGHRGIGHQWAYLPDVAETMMRLIERADALGPFETFHMGGHWDPDGSAMTASIRRVVGRPNLPVRAFPWPVVTLASPFVTLFREMREMHYLWREPVRLDNARLVAVLGAEPHTPLDTAVRTTLVGLGCMGGA